VLGPSGPPSRIRTDRIGSGRFAVSDISENTEKTLRVFLVETSAQQRGVALGCNRSKKIDLAVDGDAMLAKMRDPYYERERRC